MEAMGAVLDKTTFEAIKDTIEARGLEQAELEKLNQVIRGYSLQKGEQMSASQIRGLLKDGSYLTKSVDDVVAELVRYSITVSQDMLKHSVLGEFNSNGRLINWGHGQANIDYLNQNNIEYNIVKVYDNGVRVENIPSHKNKFKRTGTGQAWFPESWTEIDIKNAGEYVANIPENMDVSDGT